MKRKVLVFSFRGEIYNVNEQGHIKMDDWRKASGDWVFLGGSRHHWRKGIDVTLQDVFKEPEKLNGCLGWDRDHGIVRQWGGRYAGRLPRIRGAYVTEA